MNDATLRVIRIIDGTTVDGPGFRTSIYFAGCAHQCPGCHNPQSWDSAGGESMSIAQIVERIERNDMDVTFSGGDPIYQWEALTPLAVALKERGRRVWCYTGFLFEELKARPELRRLLESVDVIVDGPFVSALKDPSLIFRGSSNQRLIRCADSLRNGATVYWQSEF